MRVLWFERSTVPIVLTEMLLNKVVFLYNISFLILHVGVSTEILIGVSPIFKCFGPMILLMFSGGGLTSMGKRSLFYF